jgi:hypothetical protein
MSSGSCLTSKLFDKIIKIPSKSHETIPLKQGSARLDVRKNLFTQRFVKMWNEAPAGGCNKIKNVQSFEKSYKKLLRNGPGGMPDE